jgi:hypothetical protein
MSLAPLAAVGLLLPLAAAQEPPGTVEPVRVSLVLPPQNTDQAVVPAELVQGYALFDAETVAVWARPGDGVLPVAERLALRRFHGLIEVGPEGDAVAWLGHAETAPMTVALTAEQVAGFGLQSGDTILGWATPPAEGETRWHLVDTPETALPIR